jgi:WD40 repeat protein
VDDKHNESLEPFPESTKEKQTESGQPAKEAVGLVRIFRGHTGAVRSVAFSPDGKYVLSGGGNSSPYHDLCVRLWDIATGKELHRFSSEELVHSVAFSPDGRYLLAGTGHMLAESPKGALLWELQSRKLVQLMKMPRTVSSVAFTSDGRIVACMPSVPAFRFFDRAHGDELATIVLKHPFEEVNYCAFSPNHEKAILGTGTARIWDVNRGTELVKLKGGKGMVWSAAFSPDGRLAATGNGHWDIANGKAFYIDCTVRVWNAENGQELHQLEGHKDYVRCVAFTPDSGRLISGSGNAIFKPNKKALSIVESHPGIADTSLRLWRVKTGEQLHCFEGHTDAVLAVAISPDGRYALSGSEDQTMRLWRLPD